MALVSSPDLVSQVVQAVQASPVVTIDAETTGLKPWEGDRVIGVGVGTVDGRTFYLPFRHEHGPNLDLSAMAALFEALHTVRVLVGHNLKFDLAALYQDGYDPGPRQALEDVMSLMRLCEPDRHPDLSLTGLTAKYLGTDYAAYDAEFIAKLKQLKLTKKRIVEAPVDLVGEYCEGDVDRTGRLREVAWRVLEDTDQVKVGKQEVLVTRVLWKMERDGVGIDRAYGEHALPVLQRKIEQIRQEMYNLAGGKFNPNSSPQLTNVMKVLGVKPAKRSEKTDQPSWDKEVLEQLAADGHALPQKLLELRDVQKVEGTDIRPRMERGLDELHEPIKSFGAITGRMSSGLHTFPREGIEVDDETVTSRNLVVPRPGFKLYLADYSQMEMRVFADYIGDPDLLERMEREGFDFHDYVAKEVWGVDESHPDWKEYRRRAKGINFGLIYGIGIKKLAKNLGVDVDEAREYKAQYFSRLPGAEQFISMVGRVAETRGYVRNRFGRRYWIDPYRSYVAVNYLVQGTSADIMKNRMVALDKQLEARRLASRILLQVHDELIVEVAEDEIPTVPLLLKEVLEKRVLSTLLAVDLSIGNPGWGNKADLTWCSELADFHIVKEHKERCVGT